MQLFITDHFEIKNNEIYIYDEEIIHQLSKVLRSKAWETIYIQKNNIYKSDNQNHELIRYELEISAISKSQIIANIKNQTINQNTNSNRISIAIPYMNKREKYDRVVQKLWEIWIDEIIFWRAERSIIHELSDNKIQRYNKIAKEAVEQSWWSMQPNIQNIKNIYNCKYDNIYIADYDWVNINKLSKLEWSILFIVWPEWWLTQNEIQKFTEIKAWKIVLWNTVLRTETAAVVWWRWLKNIL